MKHARYARTGKTVKGILLLAIAGGRASVIASFFFAFHSSFGCPSSSIISRYTTISIKVVPKTREEVEYGRERLIGKDYIVLFPEYITFLGVNRDNVSVETKICFVSVFLIVTTSKLFALVFDFSALLGDNLN